MLLATMITTCAAASTPSAQVQILGDETAVESQLLAYMRRLSSINVSVGDQPINFVVGSTPTSEVYRTAVSARIRDDFSRIYSSDIDRVRVIYLAVGERRSDDVVFAIPVIDVNGDGTYRRVEGLMYFFDKGRSQVRRVTSDRY